MKKIIFIGLLSFLFAALWQLPLNFAKPYAEKYTQGLKMGDVDGTIWNGSAENIAFNEINFSHIDWKVSPLKSLQTLSLALSFNISDTDLKISGFAGLTPNKTLILDKTKFDIGAPYLNKLQRNVSLVGDVKGLIQHAEIDQKNLPVVNAIIDWKNAAVTAPMTLPSGDYKAIIRPNSEGLLATLSSFEAPAELGGKITLNKAWLYDANLSLKSSNPSISPMLGLLGKKDADGSVHIKRTGDLKPFLKK